MAGVKLSQTAIQSLTVLSSGPYVATALAGGGDFAARVRQGAGPLWDITHPTFAGGTGVADNGVPINNALIAANAAGGGDAYVPAGTFTFTTPIQLLNSARLRLDAGAILQWTGAVGGSLVTNAVANPLMRSGVIGGGRIDPRTSATGFGLDLHSPQFCQFDVEFLSGSTTFTIMRMASDATNATGYQATRNAVWNYTRSLLGATCGTGIRFVGQASGTVTLNVFDQVNVGPCSVVGMVAQSPGYNDTNVMIQGRFQLGANGAIGVDLGENNTSVNVYNWTFSNLATDDPTNTFTGMTGIMLRASAKTKIGNYYPQFLGSNTTINPGIATSWEIVDSYGLGGGSLLVRSVGRIHPGGGKVLQLPAYTTPYTPNLDLGDWIAMTLTGPITVNLPAAPMAGTYPEFTFAWIQDAGAGRIVTYNGNYKIGSSAPAMITTSNVMTMDRFLWDGGLWRLVSRMTGY